MLPKLPHGRRLMPRYGLPSLCPPHGACHETTGSERAILDSDSERRYGNIIADSGSVAAEAAEKRHNYNDAEWKERESCC